MLRSRLSLTPEALLMVDTIARRGSFAAAARELGRVPSALTYSVRQLEEALDVLLFDRSSRQARLTAAGAELLHEGRRLLQEIDAVANRVRRVAHGWEAELTIAVDDVVSMTVVLELVQAFCAARDPRDPRDALGKGDARDAAPPAAGAARRAGPPTRLRLRSEVLTGTWEALTRGQADLAIGVGGDGANPGGIVRALLSDLAFVFCVAPHHALAASTAPLEDGQLVHHRAIAVADTAVRLPALSLNLLPGQDVLTVASMRDKLDALRLGLGCGFLPEPLARADLAAGALVARPTARASPVAALHYAWRAERGAVGLGRALQWWLAQLASPVTRRALLDRHAALQPA